MCCTTATVRASENVAGLRLLEADGGGSGGEAGTSMFRGFHSNSEEPEEGPGECLLRYFV